MGNIAVADDALIIVAGVTIVYIAGVYIVQQNGKTIGSYPDLKTAQKNAQYLLNKAGDGLKWIWNIQKFQKIKIQKISMKKGRLENKEIKVEKRIQRGGKKK